MGRKELHDRTGWREELHKKIIDYLIDHGHPVTTNSRQYYGWTAPDWGELSIHMKTCTPDYARCSWEDREWTEFGGAFAESDDRQLLQELLGDVRDVRGVHTGIEATVYCRCGKIKDRKWRMTGGYAKMLRDLTREEE